MNVLQLIDSLNPGGAERVAVNMANALVGRIDNSHLCVTRKEGSLKNALDDKVQYHFLGKRRSLDMKALYQLKRIIKQNKIDIIHAHTTSYFIAAQLKMIMPSIKILWHEHHGARIKSQRKKNRILRQAVRRFEQVVTVNTDLRDWWQDEMKITNVVYIPNFVVSTAEVIPHQDRNKRIVCLANLRVPKNHLNLLKAFATIKNKYPDWNLQLVGKDLNDEYSIQIHEFIETSNLTNVVEITGERSNTQELLQQASIGVLSSSSEGLPMTILEYGAAGLAVISTDVGNCADVIANFGKVVPKEDHEQLAKAMEFYMTSESERINDARNYREHVLKHYSDKAVISEFIKLYQS